MELFYMAVSISLIAGSAAAFLIAAAAFTKTKQPFLLTVAGAMLCFLLGEVYWATCVSVEGTTPHGFHIPDLSFVGYFFFLITGAFGVMSDVIRKESGKPSRRYLAFAAPTAVAGLSVALILLGRAVFTTIAYFIPTAVFVYFSLRSLLVIKQSPTAARLKWYNLCGLLLVALIQVSYFFDAFHSPVGNGLPMFGVALVLAAQAWTAVKGVRE